MKKQIKQQTILHQLRSLANQPREQAHYALEVLEQERGTQVALEALATLTNAPVPEWRRRTVKRFQATLNHEPDIASPLWPSELQDDDEINAWIYESNRDRPLADVLSDSREVFQHLMDAIAAFSDDDLQDPHHFEWLEGEPLSGRFVFSHFHEEHELDMRAWRDRIRREVKRKR